MWSAEYPYTVHLFLAFRLPLVSLSACLTMPSNLWKQIPWIRLCYDEEMFAAVAMSPAQHLGCKHAVCAYLHLACADGMRTFVRDLDQAGVDCCFW